MTRKENDNGNCFEAWLQEYKTRLQQVNVRGGLGNGGQSSCSAAPETDQEQHADDNPAGSPAFAGGAYVLSQQPMIF